jgi:isoleucyl-tRNA synthetase
MSSESTSSEPKKTVLPTGQLTPGAREEAIRRFWHEQSIFEKAVQKEAPNGKFVFYDGPPYATGLPHYGHLLQSAIKDIIPRYKTMKGYSVPRKWGWDCHGLPIENLIEKELGLKDKKAIEEYGIAKFNKAAKDSVFRYDADWKRIIDKLGRWVDMESGYHTMDSSYTESVWWSFKTLSEKGLVYEAYKAMPFCPRCQTTLSNFEVGQGYKDIPDISVYVLFELKDEPGTSFLAWTTTPWTLPGNMALAVSPELEYSLIEISPVTDEKTPSKVWLASGLVQKLVEKKVITGTVTVLKTAKGSEFVGKEYTPVFDFYTKPGTLADDQETKRANAWKVYAADFVTAEDGTGIVHIAAFGSEDVELAHKHEIPMIVHVAKDGVIKEGNGPLSGLTAKPKGDHQATDIEAIKYLAHHNTSNGLPLLFAKEKIIHSYPHCWRCETPLLIYATSSWFVRVTELQNKLIEENKKINWVPKEVGENRFGEWLANVRDWNVSRSRYWGAPLPVWRNETTNEVEFIGGVAELKNKIAGRGNTFKLMRHGECETNVKNIINSSEKDLNLYGLTEKGKAEARASAEKMKAEGQKITKIYTSDFRRTRETAEIVAEVFGIDLKEITLDKRAREINGGDFDGGNWEKRAEFFANINEKLFKQVPNGESVFDVKKRSSEMLYDIDSKNTGEHVLVLTHGLPLRLMTASSNGKTARDFLRSDWRDVSDPTASVHEIDFKQLPHNEDYELDLHRPFIDEITWTNEKGEKYSRVAEVFDVWYDSGSMPFAQSHYPFENKDTFNIEGSSLFPADFIAEGLDQTRGWFYSLLVLGIGLFGKSPYKNVSVTGLILAEDGRKMSKSLKNYPEAEPTIDLYGADSLRYMLAASPATHGEEVLFSEKALDEVNKKVFNRLENVYSFYDMYRGGDDCNCAAVVEPESTHVLDLWVLARLAETKETIEKGFETLQIDKATRSIGDFVDDLSTWYLRRSRDRFKSDDLKDKNNAIQTTQYVLVTFAKLMAPIVPFMAEYMYLRTRDAKIDEAESVHLTEWPVLKAHRAELIEGMVKTRKIIESGLALRSKSGIKARQPLASFTYAADEHELSPELEEIVLDEMNVKKIVRGTEIALDTEITEDLKLEGVLRDITRSVQEKRKEQDLNPSDEIEIEVFTNDTAVAEKAIGGYSELAKKASIVKFTFTEVAPDSEKFTTEKFEISTGVFASCLITSTKQKHM